MTKRKDLIKELKEDAKKAWDFIETCATSIGKYGLLVLSLYSDGSTNQHEFAPIKEQEVKKEISVAKFDNALQAHELDSTKMAYWQDFNPVNTPFKPVFKSVDDRTTEIYNSTAGAQIDGKVNIKDLIEIAGVKVEDMQEVINQNKDILTQLEPGTISTRLARSADKVHGSLDRNCLAGVQNIFLDAGYGEYLDGANGLWPEKIGNGKHNSACNTYKTLENTGEFITLSVENIACNTSKQSNENKEMRAFCKTLPAGTIVVCDNKLPDQIDGKNYNTLVRQYGRGGIIHGHVAIKANNGYFKSDGTEPFGPNFSNYGENVSFSIPLDTQVPKEVACAFIKQAEIRKDREQEEKYASNSNSKPDLFIQTYTKINNNMRG